MLLVRSIESKMARPAAFILSLYPVCSRKELRWLAGGAVVEAIES